MKRHNRHRDFWYEISSRQVNGRVSHQYTVRCHKCGVSTNSHARDLTDDGLRKVFQRQGWSIGRGRNQHLCPQHSRPEKPPQNGLWQAWAAASEAQRRAFLEDVMQASPDPAPWQHGHQHPPSIKPEQEEPEPTESNEPADWWQDLMKQ